MTRTNRWGRLVAAAGLLMASSGVAVLLSAPADASGELHSYVCKYKQTPDGQELLQSGQNPIFPSNSSLGVTTVSPGQKFNDAQGYSIALGDGYINLTTALKPEPDVSLCNGDPVEAIPAAPTFTEPTCEADGSVDLPALAEGVDHYDVTGSVAAGGTVTVTAVAKDGYAFAAGTTTQWTHTFTTPDDAVCHPAPPVVTAEEPTYTEATCTSGADAVVPADTTDVTYALSGDETAGGSVVITATAQNGTVFSDGTTTQEFTHTFDAAPTGCDPSGPQRTTAEEPAWVDPTCDSDAEAGLPADTDTVSYVLDGTVGAGEAVVVTATAAAGYVFADGSTTATFEHAFAAAPTDCPVVDPPGGDDNGGGTTQVDAPQLHTPVTDPPAGHHTTAVASPTVVTPTVVKAGLAGTAAGQVEGPLQQAGLGLFGAGIVMLVVGGAASPKRSRGEA